MGQLINIMEIIDKVVIDLNAFIIENESNTSINRYEIVSVKARLENLKDLIQDEVSEYESRLTKYVSNSEANNTL